MFKERGRRYKITFVLFDLAVICLSWYVAYVLRREIPWPSPFLIDDQKNLWYFYSAVFGSITHQLIFLGGNLYNYKREHNFALELKSLVLGSVFNLAFLLAIIFFFRPISYSRGFFIYQTVTVIVLVSISHYLIRRFLRSRSRQGKNVRHVLILGTSHAAVRFCEHMIGHPEFGYQVRGLVGPESGYREHCSSLDLPWLGELDQYKDIAHKLNEDGQLDMVVAALPPEQFQILTSVYRFCEFESVDLKIIPDYLGVLSITGRVEEIEGLPVLSIRTVPLLRGYNWLLKRLFDIFFSLLAVLALLPVYVLIAVLIKLTSRGPVLLRQVRMGLDRKPFGMLKFRTMYEQTEEESDTVWGGADDPRRTWIGRYLRKFSLDETPQFLHVLFGQMSIVGPRPERPHFVEQFKHEVEGYMQRHRMKAGLTGWAQVNGLRGDTSIEERVKYDIYYIENWSIWFDIRICFHTVRILVKGENS
jgi:Undecaprenyl-phosphate glucose phosphotransferase